MSQMLIGRRPAIRVIEDTVLIHLYFVIFDLSVSASVYLFFAFDCLAEINSRNWPDLLGFCLLCSGVTRVGDTRGGN